MRRLSFGNAGEQDPLDVWASPPFARFRGEVVRYAYPHCSDCTVVPCSDILAEAGGFERDCYGTEVPCGHCPWCSGGVRCLS